VVFHALFREVSDNEITNVMEISISHVKILITEFSVNYYLSASDHVTGPYEKEELLESLKYGIISPEALICEVGTDLWQPIAVITGKKMELAKLPAHQTQPPVTPFTELQERAGVPIQVTNQYFPAKSAGTAVLLEILPGVFFQTFGIGNLYAGNITTGLVMMLSYWAFTVVNFFLVFLLIGLITWPLTFITYLVISIISAQKSAERANWKMIMNGNSSVPRALPPA
jgi:TM2 domain-containing membrane protein YozV